MRYCDKCGAEITSGGHNSCASGIFGTPFICDDCYEKEADAGTKAISGIARLFVGIIIGLCEVAGLCTVLSAITNGLSDAASVRLLVGVEVVTIIIYLTSKIWPRFLRNRFLKFLLRIAGYFSFWLALVLGVSLYFIIKYAV